MSDAFNYVAALVSIVTGLTATNLLSGLSEMIQVANRPRIYWVHTLWLINFFIELMLYWWVLYRWRMAPEWTFFLSSRSTVPGILVYLASAILFPGELESTGSPSWRDYYYKNRDALRTRTIERNRSSAILIAAHGTYMINHLLPITVDVR